MTGKQEQVLEVAGLDALIRKLAADGFCLAGPRYRDGAIVLDEIAGAADLPQGWLDEQAGGRYRLRREGDAFFGYTVGPQSWKKFLHPPRQVLWRTIRDDQSVTIVAERPNPQPLAFIGVRSCEISAIAIQDRVMMAGPFVDPRYAARRGQVFIVAVNCGRAVDTCFCTSMGTGPRAEKGYDIALTEIATGENAAFLAEAGSERGAALLKSLPSRAATVEDRNAAAAATDRATEQISRKMETEGLPALLSSQAEHPRWNDVAARCLSCGNCTMVCPTCFCTTVEDASDLEGGGTSRTARWDSCFTSDFSYIHGGAVRESTRSHYRQWMTHKLATWHDQFDTSGCVGCGRCITWCPVGIDITEEAAQIRATSHKAEQSHGD